MALLDGAHDLMPLALETGADWPNFILKAQIRKDLCSLLDISANMSCPHRIDTGWWSGISYISPLIGFARKLIPTHYIYG